jgi:hypothetical protein
VVCLLFDVDGWVVGKTVLLHSATELKKLCFSGHAPSFGHRSAAARMPLHMCCMPADTQVRQCRTSLQQGRACVVLESRKHLSSHRHSPGPATTNAMRCSKKGILLPYWRAKRSKQGEWCIVHTLTRHDSADTAREERRSRGTANGCKLASCFGRESCILAAPQ